MRTAILDVVAWTPLVDRESPVTWRGPVTEADRCERRPRMPCARDCANYLRFYMTRLRQKLEPEPSRPRHLLTEPGLGYRFQP